MAKIKLSDGRVIPVVKPHLGDQMDLERQMRSLNPKYGAEAFREDLKLGSFQTVFNLFASFNRAGIPVTVTELFELDLGSLEVEAEPGDEPVKDVKPESEGEQSSDPLSTPTGDGEDG